MENISFTTFLKISLMPSTQSKLGVVHQLHNSAGGYDFYKRMKLAAQEVADGSKKPDDVFDELKQIKRFAERTHNLLMAKRFWHWWKSLEGAIVLSNIPKGVYRTEEMKFGIRLLPELAYAHQGADIITYLWATKLPKLTRQVAAMGLHLLKLELQGKAPSARFQIYDLREERAHTEDLITNQSSKLLVADIALLNSVWPEPMPKAA